MIGLTIESESAQRNLIKIARKLSDRRAANKALAAKMHQLVMTNFQQEGHEGTPWAALAPSTRRWKERHGYSRILQNTGTLRNSFTFAWDNDSATVFAQPYVDTNPSGKKKAPRDLARYHEEGTSRMPRRKMLPSLSRALKEAIVIYKFFVERTVRS